ncbi:very short patch repair endonuclease [Rhizobium leguminosarum]|uniref:very short patch repair endonuclease n=1 Tax=Rhizobium leguminosarum TaxID=384 RepID=UPI00197E71BE|nr:very short patch repair endonuclease [Rhizobium leguminosarum]
MKPIRPKPISDVHTPEVRSYNMSRVRGRDTRPELVIRRGLHARGYRFRLHDKGLPGRPDLVFSKRRATVFVHGCFWHGHDCPLFRMPATRTEFWAAKITANRSRDAKIQAALVDAGWRVLTVWECSLRGVDRWPQDQILDFCETFLNGAFSTHEIVNRDQSTGRIHDYSRP